MNAAASAELLKLANRIDALALDAAHTDLANEVRDLAESLASPAQVSDGVAVGYMPFAQYEGKSIALPHHAAKSIGAVQMSIIAMARDEGFKGTIAERLQELEWEILPVFTHPSPSGAQVVDAKCTCRYNDNGDAIECGRCELARLSKRVAALTAALKEPT